MAGPTSVGAWVVTAEVLLTGSRGPGGQAATVAQTAEFLDCYQRAAHTVWEPRDVRQAWAAGLWVRLFNAKKGAMHGGGPQLDLLAEEIDARLALAGLDRRR